MTRFLATTIAIAAIVLTLSAPAYAKDGKDRSDRGSLPESVRKAERQTGGSVLSAEPVEQDGRQVNRVKVLTNDGRVKVMEMDAEPRRSSKSSPPRGSQAQAGSNNKVEGDPDPL